MRTQDTRGQAAVELALGSLVLVTLLLFSIYFGEVTFTALKVQEAENSALFDLTNFKHHTINRLSYSTAPIGTAVAATQANTLYDYKDYDGRTIFGDKPYAGFVHVATGAPPMQVRCARGGGPSYTPNPLVFAMYDDNSGAQCWTQTDLFTINIPSSFAEKSTGGFFSGKQHWQRASLRVCGQGKAIGGNCSGRSTIMLDDWGLTGPPQEWMPAPGMAGSGFATLNTPYWWTAYKGYNTSYGLVALANPTMFTLPASQLAMIQNLGVHPMSSFAIPVWIPLVTSLMDNESKFYMSFDSSITGFEHLLIPMMGGLPERLTGLNWETTPFLVSLMPYSVAFFQRMGNGGCYLGLPC